jgi:hypothetical protein
MGAAADTPATATPQIAAAAPAVPPAAAPAAEGALSYDRSGGTVSVRGFRLLVLLTLINTTLLGSMVLGPQLAGFAKQQFQSWKDARAERRRLQADLVAQQQCATYAPPPTKVVYEEDPAEAIKLATGSIGSYESTVGGRSDAPPGWVSPVRAALPDACTRFLEAMSGGGSARGPALLFLHERSDPAGNRFVVMVWLNVNTAFDRRLPGGVSPAREDVTFTQQKQRELIALVCPLGPSGPSVDARGKEKRSVLRLALPDDLRRVVARIKPGESLQTPPPIEYGNRLRVFAGQADAKDPSHLTMDYVLDGRAGTIDGWLRAAGFEMRPRDGKPVYDAARGEAWEVPAAAPTTNSTTAPAPTGGQH